MILEVKVMIVISVLILIIMAACIYWLAVKSTEKNIYVYPKTEHQYKVLYRCKMELPVDGTWINALIYLGLDDGNYYVRERKDFLNKFVKLKDWKNGDKNK